jgi:DNA-binding transcriptional ArsR family regulator
MEIISAARAFESLGHPTRLAVFRLLVPLGDDGMVAGAISGQLSLPPSTLSSHLAVLQEAGLIRARREGRFLHYSVHRAGLADLTGWLLQDCCGGSPELCAPVLAGIACAC